MKRGLQSIEAMDYDKDELEVIISDYMSQDNLVEVIHEFRGRLNMTYLCVDYRRYAHHKIFFNNGSCNPALAQNIAARYASGNSLILTSPEIIHWNQNLKNIDKIENLDSKFIYGKVIEKTEKEVFESGIQYPFEKIGTMDSPLVLCDFENRCVSVALYFFGVINRKLFLKYGGIDESYMRGIAYEDADFGERMSVAPELKYEFHKELNSVHLTHDRSYQNPEAVESNRVHYEFKMRNGMKHNLVANKDIKFGDADVIIEKSEFWRC